MRLFFLLFTCSLFLSGPIYAQSAVGVWKTAGPKWAHVKVYNCGSKLCGKVIKSKTPGAVDTHTGKKVVGTRIMWGMNPAGSGVWKGGNVYNILNGKTYSGKMSLKGSNSLILSGCVAGILCKSQTWSRIE